MDGNIWFIGLGIMGAPMSRNLIGAAGGAVGSVKRWRIWLRSRVRCLASRLPRPVLY